MIEEHSEIKEIINDFVESGQVYSYTNDKYNLLLIDQDEIGLNNSILFTFHIMDNKTGDFHKICYTHLSDLTDIYFQTFGNAYTTYHAKTSEHSISEEQDFLDLFESIDMDKLNTIISFRTLYHNVIDFDEEFNEFFINKNLVGNLFEVKSFLNTLTFKNFDKVKSCDSKFNYRLISNLQQHDVKDVLMITKEEKELIELNTDIVIPDYLLNTKLINQQTVLDI